MIEIEALNRMSDDLSAAMADLNEFKTLFREENMDLLNATAPFFFLRLREFYWYGLILAASRFIDPAQSRGNQNLSIKLLGKYANELPARQAEKINANLEKIEHAADIIRQYRHKLISHRDKEMAMLSSIGLPIVFVESIEEIFETLAETLNIFHHHLEDTQVEHDSRLILNGTDRLLHFLSLGVEAGKRGDSAEEGPG
ncbi:MAG TPA: hypothetical protein PLW67_07930 [Prolixibacteraceae bacterium]|nr:hypothetical protein [Prolixibacteraceae bacterium]